MKWAANRTRRAFTLIELLVVIAIIIIIATVSLVLIQSLTKGQSVKSGGRITQGAFSKARQLAAAQRVTHFLVFANGTDPATGMITGRMEVHRDVNRNNIYDPPFANSPDIIVDQAIMLPKGLRFHTRAAGGYPQQAAPAWLAFLSDGSIVQDNNYFPDPDVSSSQYDADFSGGNLTWTRSDLTVEQSSNAPGKVYLDFTRPTGKLRKIVYWDN